VDVFALLLILMMMVQLVFLMNQLVLEDRNILAVLVVVLLPQSGMVQNV